jgi:hypothetical protein
MRPKHAWYEFCGLFADFVFAAPYDSQWGYEVFLPLTRGRLAWQVLTLFNAQPFNSEKQLHLLSAYAMLSSVEDLRIGHITLITG